MALIKVVAGVVAQFSGSGIRPTFSNKLSGLANLEKYSYLEGATKLFLGKLHLHSIVM
jgi:hypothetical protein